ncbi:hypothetical protein SPHS6_00765 [Sphingobium sp. S6]|nr:hypothetical protein SPHS6_00765 [Sphingobium sp. S6]CAD7336013.1 hypothetical protein SPHS8_00805 [Sphingobium sp. S8]
MPMLKLVTATELCAAASIEDAYPIARNATHNI